MVSKTKHRILQAARILFNEEGESNVALVDIAAVLDISPGNLYYHYRGKEQLIPVLFAMFEADLEEFLHADTSELSVIDDYWAFVYLLLENFYQYRFLLGLDFIRFNKSLERRRKRLQTLLVKCAHSVIDNLQFGLDGTDLEGAELEGTAAVTHLEVDRMILAENISFFIYSWVSLGDLDLDEAKVSQYLHEGVYRIFYQVGLSCGANQHFLSKCAAFRHSMGS
jgi:AcrR family transcriptional regulator